MLARPSPYPSMAGVLFAEDFDAEPAVPASPEEMDESGCPDESPGLPEPPVEPSYSATEMDEAIKSAVEQAIAQTRASVTEELNNAVAAETSRQLDAIQTSLHDMRATMDTKLSIYANAVSKSLLEAFMTAFPQWAQIDLPGQTASFLADILPLFSSDFQVTLTLSPETKKDLMAVQKLDTFFKNTWLTVTDDPNIKNYNFEIAWPNGHIVRNLDKIVATLLSTLATSSASAQLAPQTEHAS